MRTAGPPLLPIFRSDLQARLLAELLPEPGAPHTTAELREVTGASPASLHRELGRLVGAGILAVDRIGRTMRYRAAADSPLVEPLRELLRRTLGAEALLRDALAAIDGLEAAAVYGSWARGEVTPDSDIDVLVIGDMAPGLIYDAVREPERIVGRDIDVRVYGRDEIRRRRAAGSTFLEDALSRPLTLLVGDVREAAG